jgi:hypothetical protein
MGSPRQLALDRAISHEKRIGLTKYLVEYHLTEVNCLGDQVRYAQGHPEEVSEEEMGTVDRRCRMHLQSVELLGPEIFPMLARWAESSLDEPQDALGLGFMLEAIGGTLDELRVRLDPRALPQVQHGRDLARQCRCT